MFTIGNSTVRNCTGITRREMLRTCASGFGAVARQLTILVLALALGRLTGRALHLQKACNLLGRYAKQKFSDASAGAPGRFSDGFITCTLLFCVVPISILGSIQDGLAAQWQTLAIKAVIDGLATMAFVPTFGWSAILAIVPVIACQGTMTLAARMIEPQLRSHGLLDSVNATSGLLIFCIALIILELKKVELADYLPSLVFAPILTWFWH
jgi:uncharacterized membrane protein YqgA involved in biofilm formation